MLNEYGYPVMYPGDLNLSEQSFLPDSDMPGLTSERDLDKRVDTETQDPDVNPITNRARNSDLELLRSMHPFVTIDPPLSQAYAINLNYGDAELVIPVPTNAVMYRITYAWNGLTAMLALSNTRGIDIALGTAGDKTNIIINPANSWRACRGQREVVLKHVGTASRMLGSVEFFCQL